MSVSYQIKLPQFEGPFDLLLFFIERDELDIYNIPIARITNEFLSYVHSMESLNIELASEFILFVSQHGTERTIDLYEPPIQISNGHADRRMIDDIAEARLAFL